MNEDITTIMVRKILEEKNIKDPKIIPLHTGFNRKSFCVNDKYIIKICINAGNDTKILNEINFYKQNNGSKYYPKLLSYDTSKSIIPYIYTIEEKINGKLLFDIWGNLSNKERIEYLNQLLVILKSIHKTVNNIDGYASNLANTYSNYLQRCKILEVFNNQELEYLSALKEIILNSFDNAKMGYIHGDIHFNNIIVDEDKLKLIDFENYNKAPIDLEFDSIYRMVRNPNSFVQNGESSKYFNPKDYPMIIDFFKKSYPNICQQDGFDDRIIIYDCLNSIKWIAKYPNYQLYRNVLFNDSKKLKK